MLTDREIREMEMDIEERYESGQRNRKMLKFCWPFMLIWCAIETFLFPILWILGLTGTFIKAYDSAQKER